VTAAAHGHAAGRIARPHVAPENIEASYRDMAADQAREQEALEWCEGVVGDSLTEP